MEKRITLQIQNGKIEGSVYFDDGASGNSFRDLGLKEIAIVIEALKKEQEKIMNRQKDEVLKFNVDTSDNMEIVTNNLVLSDGKQDAIRPTQKDAIKITWNKHIPNELMVIAHGELDKIKGGKIKIDWD